MDFLFYFYFCFFSFWHSPLYISLPPLSLFRFYAWCVFGVFILCVALTRCARAYAARAFSRTRFPLVTLAPLATRSRYVPLLHFVTLCDHALRLRLRAAPASSRAHTQRRALRAVNATLTAARSAPFAAACDVRCPRARARSRVVAVLLFRRSRAPLTCSHRTDIIMPYLGLNVYEPSNVTDLPATGICRRLRVAW